MSHISAHNSGTHRVQNGCKKCVPYLVLIFDGSSGNRGKVQSLLFDLFKAFFFDREQSQIGFFSSPKRPIFLNACATCSELPSIIYHVPWFLGCIVLVQKVKYIDVWSSHGVGWSCNHTVMAA